MVILRSNPASGAIGAVAVPQPASFAATSRPLPEGDMALPRIARRLGVGARTLQRRLNDQQLVYRDLVDEVRRVEALDLVRSTDLSIFEISYRIGVL